MIEIQCASRSISYQNFKKLFHIMEDFKLYKQAELNYKNVLDYHPGIPLLLDLITSAIKKCPYHKPNKVDSLTYLTLAVEENPAIIQYEYECDKCIFARAVNSFFDNDEFELLLKIAQKLNFKNGMYDDLFNGFYNKAISPIRIESFITQCYHAGQIILKHQGFQKCEWGWARTS